MQKNTKVFHLHEIRHIPVEVSQEAQEVLDISNHETRILPLALSEAFGAIRAVTRIFIDLVDKIDLFPDTPHIDEKLLRITANHFLSIVPDHVWHINVFELQQLHPGTRLPIVSARTMADELVRLYPHTETKYVLHVEEPD